MFSRFFIDRPIFAVVISMFFVIAGLAAMRSLPIAQYPGDRPAGRHRAGGVSRRLRRGDRTDGRRTARERHQRRPGHDLHDLELVVERRGADPGHLRDRHQHRHRRASTSTTASSRSSRACPSRCAGRASSVEHGSSAFLQVLAFYSPDGRYDDLFTSQLRDAQRARSAEARCRARPTCRSSAPRTTRCGSGCGPTASRS